MPRQSKLKSMGGRMVSARSKTGDPACSQAMSQWVRGRNAGTAVAAAVFQILGKCRAKARALKFSALHHEQGNHLQGQVWARRAERGLSDAGRRQASAELMAQRAARGPRPSTGAAPAPAPRAVGRGTPERMARAAMLRAERAAKAAPVRKHIDLDVHAHYGYKPWLARITGTHAKYGLSRDFVRADARESSRSGKTGGLKYVIDTPGLYQLGGSKHDNDTFIVYKNKNGSIDWLSIDAARAKAIAKHMDAGASFDVARKATLPAARKAAAANAPARTLPPIAGGGG